MSTIVTRSGKGAALTWTEVDSNFTNINNDKYQEGSAIGSVTPAAATFTTLTATGQVSLGGVTDVESLRVSATGGTAGSNNYLWAVGGSTSASLYTWGTASNIPMLFRTRGSGQYDFATGSSSSNIQSRISHTASAVNYVQITGAATGSNPTISTQGSDTNAGLTLQSKGTFGFTFRNSSNGTVASITHGGSSTPNYVQLAATVPGSAPSLNVAGTDTNIDLNLTPKGTGNVRFGTLTASADAPITGYITIKDSGGTVRKLAVIA